MLEKTKKDYDLLARQFSLTRQKFWPEFLFLKNYIKENDRILDIGCGNGRLIEILKDKKVFYIGIDNSKAMLKIARKKYPSYQFLLADALSLPFPDNSFDKIFIIAVFHHIPSKKLRKKFLKESYRVLKAKGLVFLSVWNLFKPQFLAFWWNSLKEKLLKGKDIEFNDLFYPFRDSSQNIITQRYVHAFTKKELETIFKKSGFKILETGFVDRGKTKKANFFIIAQKPLAD